MALQIKSLGAGQWIRSGFDCGVESLNRYLQKQSSQDIKRRVATVFVLTEPPNTHVLAYYALSAYTVAVSELEPDLAKRLPQYPQLPATLLGRLAVDQQHRGKGLGELMLMDALKRSLDASVQVASLAVVAEALDEQAACFYAKYGFQPVQESPLKLYLPMKTVERLF